MDPDSSNYLVTGLSTGDAMGYGDLKVAVCGAINLDIVLFVDRIPVPGQEVKAKRLRRVPGGTGANVAVAVARLLGKERVAFLGALGKDSIGRYQLKVLEEEGIVTDAVKMSKAEESGQAYILVDGRGENVIATYFGANLDLTPDHVRSEACSKVLRSCKVCVVMDPPLESGIEVLKMCKLAGGITVWDPGVLASLGIRGLAEGIAASDYLILNELEAKAMFSSLDPKIIFKRLLDVNKGVKLIVKMGEKGSALYDVANNKLIKVSAVPLKDVGLKVVSTVGCGDAFVGAFASFRALGMEDVECLIRANCAGGYKATKEETRGSPTMDDLKTMLAKVREKLSVDIINVKR